MVNEIKNMLEAPLEQIGLEIYDIEFEKEGNDYFLRVYIDKDGGVDLNCVVDATRVVSDILDEKDPIEQEYMLEVSSPGAERPLNSKDKLAQEIDQYIRLEFKDPKQGMDCVEGYLKAFDNDIATVEYKVKTASKLIDVDYDNIKKARKAIKF